METRTLLLLEEGRERSWEITWDDGPVVETMESIDGVAGEVVRHALGAREVPGFVNSEIAARLAAGWTEEDSTRSRPSATHEDLEAMIRADPDAVEPYLVYADWLEAHGDPRGELIVMQHRELDEAEVLLRRRADHFLGELANVLEAVRLEWRLGFIRAAVIAPPRDAGDPSHMAAVTLRRLLAHPSARFLRRLEIQRADSNADYTKTIDAICELGLPSTMQELSLGRLGTTGRPTTAQLPRLGEALARSPSLERVVIRGGAGYEDRSLQLSGINLPRAKHFELRSAQPRDDPFYVVASARWPQLTTLILVFSDLGYREPEGRPTAGSLTMLLSAASFPMLRELTLGVPSPNDLIPALAQSPLLLQLTKLDLSGCHLSNEDAQAILQSSAFDRLRELRLPAVHTVPEEAAAKLRARRNVRFVEQEAVFTDAYDDDMLSQTGYDADLYDGYDEEEDWDGASRFDDDME